MARALCAYAVFDAANIPAAKRKNFLAVAVRRWSPFVEPQFHAEWFGARAMVWSWPGALVSAGVDEIAGAPKRVWPESLFRGQPEPEGVRLLALDEGVEGRVWRDGVLVASQWWPDTPPRDEWEAFLRGAGLPPAGDVPVPVEAPLQDAPWSRQRAVALNDFARHRRALALAAVAAAAFAIAMPLAASLRLLTKTVLLERVIAEDEAKVAHLLAAREAAERDRAAVERALALRPPARQLELLSAAIAATPGTGWTLLEWRMPDRRTVEAVLRMPSPDPAALVRGWEKGGLFRDVTVDLGRSGGEVTVRARLDDPLAAEAAQ